MFQAAIWENNNFDVKRSGTQSWAAWFSPAPHTLPCFRAFPLEFPRAIEEKHRGSFTNAKFTTINVSSRCKNTRDAIACTKCYPELCRNVQLPHWLPQSWKYWDLCWGCEIIFVKWRHSLNPNWPQSFFPSPKWPIFCAGYWEKSSSTEGDEFQWSSEGVEQCHQLIIRHRCCVRKHDHRGPKSWFPAATDRIHPLLSSHSHTWLSDNKSLFGWLMTLEAVLQTG